MIRLTSDSCSLLKETVEDGVLYAFYLFGRREPVLSRGNPHYKELGNLFTYTFITPPLSSSGEKERESFPCLFPYLFLLTVSAQRLYRWVLSLISFARAVVPLPPGGGTATMLYNS